MELNNANKERDLAQLKEKQANELVHATRAELTSLRRELYEVEVEKDKLKI